MIAMRQHVNMRQRRHCRTAPSTTSQPMLGSSSSRTTPPTRASTAPITIWAFATIKWQSPASKASTSKNVRLTLGFGRQCFETVNIELSQVRSSGDNVSLPRTDAVQASPTPKPVRTRKRTRIRPVPIRPRNYTRRPPILSISCCTTIPRARIWPKPAICAAIVLIIKTTKPRRSSFMPTH